MTSAPPIHVYVPLTIDNINPNIRRINNEFGSEMVSRVLELEDDLKKGIHHSFTEVIQCNYGDGQAMGQKPINFLRQVITLVVMPDLLNDSEFPTDAKVAAQRFLDSCAGFSVGSYSDATGVDVVREDCAAFISRRDGIPSNSLDIFLSQGVTEAVKRVMQMMASQQETDNRAGVMIPIPQYPLYADACDEINALQIGYYLDEDNAWGVSEAELERALSSAKGKCKPRAIVVINPGNPTGQVLTRKDIEMVIRFAHKHNLLILADEVYQFNIYAADREFTSFKNALYDIGGDIAKTVTLASFMSASKGYMGECGFRGGYCELVNWLPDVKAQLYKCLSARSCSSVIGQAMLDVIVHPPQKGDQSYEEYEKEKIQVLSDLKSNGRLVTETLNSLYGCNCNEVQGAMYAFPKIELPTNAIMAAKDKNLAPDLYYCLGLLESKGVCVVPGSDFGQKEGTFHFRITIVPPVEKMRLVMNAINDYHTEFMEKYH